MMSLENTNDSCPPSLLPTSLDLQSNISLLPVSDSPIHREEYSNSGISYPDGSMIEEMECPHSKVGVVIGSKGVIIQEIMNRTSCKIVVLQDGLPDGQPRVVVITGFPQQIQLAKQLINSVIADGPSAIQSAGVEFDPMEPVDTQEMMCPAEKVGLVIGSRGVIVQDIMRRTGCKITVNQNFPEGEPRVVVITGPLQNIEFAKSLVSLVIANGPAALNQTSLGINLPGCITEEMECPHEKVGIVIGSKGTIVQDIMRRSGSRIVVNQDFPDGHPRKVIISGTPQQVRHAKHLVSSVILHGPIAVQGQPMIPLPVLSYGSVVQDLKIIQSQVGKLIGPGGSTIKDLQMRFAVKMNIDQVNDFSDERRLRITGDPAQVQAASQMVWHLLHNSGPMGMIPHHPHHAGYGMQPQMMGEGYGDPAMMHGGYYPPAPHQSASYPPSPDNTDPGLHPSQAPIGQGLGADGSAGRLMPPAPLNNGLVHQVVYVLKSLMPRLLGPNNSILHLILMKSGAHVDIESPTIVATGGQEMIKINVVGPPNLVTLVGQMIQEVLINGPDKLTSLPDIPQGVGGYDEPPPPHIGRGGGSRYSREPYGYERLSPGSPNQASYHPTAPAADGYGDMIHEQQQQAHYSRQYPPAYQNSSQRTDPYSREYNPPQQQLQQVSRRNGSHHRHHPQSQPQY